jgi:hypothetical protein
VAKRARLITFDTVREIGLTLPGAEVGTTYGSPALKVDGKMFACMAVHRSAEPHSLVVCVGFEQRDELLSGDQDTYYVTDHYVDYPTVLVRLARVHRDALRDLLRMAHQFVTAKGRRRSSVRPRRARRR